MEPGSYLVKVRSDALLVRMHLFPDILAYVRYQSCCFSCFQVGVGQESKLQEWFHLPEDMASPRCFFSSSLVVNFTAWPLGAVETKTL